MTPRRLSAVIFAAILATAPVTAFAQPAPATAEARLEADFQTVQGAMNAINTGGYPALAPHIAALKDVFRRAPATGDGQSDASQVYGLGAMLLMLNAVEGQRYTEATTYGAKASALLPDSSQVAGEYAMAYQGLDRPADSLAIVDRWLAAHPGAADEDVARLYRTRGFALIELDRLDEAEAAYRTSLQMDPNHKGAQGELDYIVELRKGAGKRDVEIMTTDKAREADH